MTQVYLRPFTTFEVFDKKFVFRLRTAVGHEVTQEQYDWACSIQQSDEVDAKPEQQAWLKAWNIASDVPAGFEQELKRDQKVWEQALEKTKLSAIELMVAQACNMRCEYCYGSDGSYNEPGMMDEKTAFAALDYLRDQVEEKRVDREVHVIFFGGEPLLNYDLIVRCTEYAEQLFPDEKVTFGMTTNLTLMTDEMLDFFATHPFQILVSFDGPRAYQSRRVLNDGRNSYDVLTERIGALLAKMPDRVAARATIYAHDDRNLVIEEFERLGFKEYQIRGASGNLGEDIAREDLFADERARTAAYREVTEKFSQLYRARDAKSIKQLMENKEAEQFIREALLGFGAMGRRLVACGVGRMMLAVSHTGDVYPCHRFVGQTGYRMGSLDEGVEPGGFADNIILRNPACRACVARYTCGGPCAHVCVCDMKPDPHIPDIFNAPESHCEMMQTRIMLVQYIKALVDDEGMDWLKEQLDI